MQKQTLYIISTPIGNLQDITFRALEVIKSCDVLICEDTRVTQKLLNYFNIKVPKLISYANHNLKPITERIIQELKKDLIVALVSDAGTPLISDPGELLVEECYNNGIKVNHIPGASSLISALVVAGFKANPFYFGGFLPNKNSERKKLLAKVKNFECTMVFFESKHRLMASLNDISSIFGDNHEVAVVRELTKLYEEVVRNTISDVINIFKSRDILGEFIIVIKEKSKEESMSEADIINVIKQEILNGLSIKALSKHIAEKYDLNKTQIYNLALTVKNGKE
ncbi:16S rRNA (cytidine(1402)-2'-O)-methyltransferase [Rickettsiales bacterium LUAb2]